jgi:rRNA biogenesis protein RRP5
MAVASKHDGKNKRARPSSSGQDGAVARPQPQHDQPRPAPSFVSTLQHEETDFPRGGGTSLTALEVKQTRAEGRREAEAEAAQGVSPGSCRWERADDRRRRG